MTETTLVDGLKISTAFIAKLAHVCWSIQFESEVFRIENPLEERFGVGLEKFSQRGERRKALREKREQWPAILCCSEETKEWKLEIYSLERRQRQYNLLVTNLEKAFGVTVEIKYHHKDLSPLVMAVGA